MKEDTVIELDEAEKEFLKYALIHYFETCECEDFDSETEFDRHQDMCVRLCKKIGHNLISEEVSE